MVRVEINSLSFFVKSDLSVLEACKFVGIYIPRFCYHESLSVAGNCRMCLVEIGNSPKPVASCALPILNDMQIFTDTPLVKKARENVVELLLLNHPLDCPICDQAGECDLQDQTKYFGGNFSRFFFEKRGVEDKNCGSLIKTIMTRCIHCTRCVRFSSEIAGVEFFGTLNRGTSTEIGGYLNKVFKSEISGNVIDLCPVGALTSKPYAFIARPWELRMIDSIDLSDGLGSSISVNFKESEILRIVPKTNADINGSIISDKARFSHDAFHKNRSFKDFKESNWSKLILKLEVLLKSTKRSVTFFVNNSLDFETLNLLKYLEYRYPNLCVYFEKARSTNFFMNWSNSDTILDLNKPSNICFIISSDIRIENAILNAKVRVKYSLNFFEIYGMGLNSPSNFSINFVNLNINKFITFIEGKDVLLSNLFLKTVNPIVFFGQVLSNRGLDCGLIRGFLKRIQPSLVVLNILKDCNDYSILYFNFNKNIKQLLFSDMLILLNIDENLGSSKFIYSYSNHMKSVNKSIEIYSFSTHNSNFFNDFDSKIFPIFSEIEEEQKYINLEGRVQKTSKILQANKNFRSFKKFLLLLTQDSKKVSESSNSVYKFLNEIILYPFKFSKVANNIISDNLKFKFYPQVISLYPVKNLFYDFYRSNKTTKISSTMSLSSRDFRKHSSNF